MIKIEADLNFVNLLFLESQGRIEDINKRIGRDFGLRYEWSKNWF